MAGLYAWCLPIELGRSRMVDLFSPQSEAARAALRRILAAP